MARVNAYGVGLDRNAANYTPLTPLSLLARTAYVYPGRSAVIHGDSEFTWSQVYARCRRLASALAQQGVGPGDTVAVMLPNVPAMYEAHFGIPMTGAVLNTLNTRLDAAAIAFMLEHALDTIISHATTATRTKRRLPASRLPLPVTWEPAATPLTRADLRRPARHHPRAH